METTAKVKKGNGVVVIAIIVAIVLLLAMLIPTWVNASKQAKQFAEYQEKNDEKIASIVEKLDATNFLTMEEIQKTISDEIAKYHKNDVAPLTETKVKEIINNALESSNILTEAKVKEIVEKALDNVDTGLSEYQVNQIVSKALANSGLTEAKVKEIINSALKGVGGLTEAEVKKIVTDALANVNSGLTEEDVKKLVEEALKKDEDPNVVKVDNVTDLIAALNAGKSIKLTKNITVEGKTVVIPKGSNVTLDLNGKTLTVNEIKDPFITTDASAFTLTGGELRITGSGNNGACALYNAGNSTMNIIDATITSTVADTQNYGTDLIINHGKFSMSGTTVNAQRGCFSEWSDYNVTLTDCVLNTEKGDYSRFSKEVYGVYYWGYGSLSLNNVTVNIKDVDYFGTEASVVGVYVDSYSNGAVSGNTTVNGEDRNFK